MSDKAHKIIFKGLKMINFREKAYLCKHEYRRIGFGWSG